MRRKKLANQITGILMAGLMVASAPMSVLAEEAGTLDTEWIEAQADAADDEVVDEDSAPVENAADETDAVGEAQEGLTLEGIEEFTGEIPAAVAADAADAEDGTTDGAPAAKVAVTISNQGVLAKANDEKPMVQREVTVTDLNNDGVLTYDEALVAAHKAYNTADGYKTEEYTSAYGSGIRVTKLWGAETSNTYFYKNGTALTSHVGDTAASTVQAGDDLYASINRDNQYYSDCYAAFDSTEKEVKAGEEFTLTLTAGGAAAAGVQIGTWNAGSFAALDGKTTGDDGKVTLSFDAAGTYYVTANGTVKGTVTTDWSTGATQEMDCPIMAPYCVVTVAESTQPKVIAEGNCGATAEDNVTWTLTDDGMLTVSGTGKIKGSLKWSADQKSKQIQKIKIENGITEIGSSSFKDLKAVTQVELLSGVKVIGMKAFAGCTKLESIIIPESVSKINIYAFDGCSSLQSITIPESVTSLTAYAFQNCTQLSTAYINASAIPMDIFKGCSKLQSVTIGENVTSISSSAFSSTGLETLYINSRKELSGGIFGGCKALRKVVIGKKVPELNPEIFSGSTSIESLSVNPENQNVIVQDDMLYSSDGKTLRYCVPQKSGEITVREGTETIGENAFKNCTKVTSISLPESMSTLGDYSFAGCTGLTKLELPESVKNLSAYTFQNCSSLKEIVVKGKNYTADGPLLYTADRETLVLCAPGYEGKVSVAEGVKTMKEGAFYGCKNLTEVTLPSSATEIGNECFYGCSGLKKLEIPNSVTSIGTKVFTGCASLEIITLPEAMQGISSSMFSGCSNLTDIEIPEKVTEIGNYAFNGCSSLANIKIPEKVTKIGSYAFSSCSSLANVEIPEGVTEIGGYAFSSCTNLQKISLPNSLSIFSGDKVFENCSSLTSVVIPEKVTSLPNEMFFMCKKMEYTVLPAGLTSITGNPWNGVPLDVNFRFKGSPKQWNDISGIKNIGDRTNITFYYGAEEDNTLISEQPQKMVCMEGATSVTPLSVRVVEAQNGESYEYTWFCNTQETITGATILSGETALEDGKGSQYTPDTSKAGNYYYYCIVAKKNAADEVVATTTSQAAAVTISLKSFNGTGSEQDPFQLATQQDLKTLYDLVAAGNSMETIYFQMTDDITLDTEWQPIGTKEHPFGGIIDGAEHTLKIAKGGLPLLGYIKGATVKKLNIYGEQIEGAGLVNNFTGIGLSGNAITIENVCLKSGSKTLKSGLVASTDGGIYAHASADFLVTIRNCVIERDVVVGYTGTESQIGSFAGRINGSIENCESSATVKGASYVGGILGTRDNAMSQCSVKNSNFHGTVEGTTLVGGIVGGGYENSTAPNGAKPTILNCMVDGTVTGDACVGGIFGGDMYVAQTWDNVVSSISANKFTGTVNGNRYVGAIIGYLNSLNRYDTVAGNTFTATDSVKNGIGYVKYLDTSYENPTVMEGTVVFNTGNGTADCPKVEGCGWKENHNRTDDPLGKDADALAKATNTLNPVCYELKAAGEYKTTYEAGEELDLTGLELTASWDNGTTTKVDLEDVTISGYDKNQTGKQSITLSYGSAKLYIFVTVNPKKTTVKVKVSILGDAKHGDTMTPHGLKNGGLTEWISEEVTADTSDTVWTVLKQIMDEHKISYVADDNNFYNTVYIKEVNGLAEFDNGPDSGWMYTVNGVHPTVGVAETYIHDQDEIILHYTDDYKLEESSENDKAVVKEFTETITDLPAAENLTLADKAQVAAAREAYELLTADQKALVSADVLAKLTAAEAKIAELEKNQHVHSWGSGVITKAPTCTEAGIRTYTCECGETKTESVPAIGHKYGAWTTTTEATVFAPAVQTWTCTVCGNKETRKVGSALKPTIKVNATTIPLKVKQTTKAFKVSGLANGDSVKSYKSGNTKIFTVTKNGVLKAGKKTGKATLTITLASGLKKKVTVKVQKKTVATTKITGLQKKLTMKNGGKLTLKPSIAPITSTQKITYKSSNKKIATVSSKGVIKAKKTGKVKITVKSGKKSFTVTVTVKKK